MKRKFTEESVPLSEQELVGCCEGGSPSFALQDIHSFGETEDENDYLYTVKMTLGAISRRAAL